MLKFLRTHLASPEPPKDDIADYVHVEKTLRHGFPNRTSAFAHDDVLSLLAVGTHTGDIHILGAENVVWQAAVPGRAAVAHLYFARGHGILIALCQDQTFHRFSIHGAQLEIATASPELRLKRITSCAMHQNRNLRDAKLLVGTVTGNVYALSAETMELSEFILYENTISTSYKLSEQASSLREGNSIDGMAVCPTHPNKILLIIDRFLILLYDIAVHEISMVYAPQQHKTMAISWCSDGARFSVAYADGSFSVWRADREEPLEDPQMPFGPFPCMPVSKSLLAKCPTGDINIFSGGMPRASYGDRYTVTAKQSDRVAVFDFAAPVLDFVTVGGESEPDSYVLVLTEQELVCVDLLDKDWRTVPLLYLHPLHSSPVTATAHASDIEEHVWRLLHKTCADQAASSSHHSHRDWPIAAGANLPAEVTCASRDANKRQLFITGHENGCVRLWSAGSSTMRLLATVNTAREFAGFVEDMPEEKDELCADTDSESEGAVNGEWPPFRKLGEYDPFCDDPRLSIHKIAYDSKTGQLVVGGRGGHVLIYTLHETARSLQPGTPLLHELIEVDQVTPHMKGERPLPVRRTPFKYPAGYQPYAPNESTSSTSIQLFPAVMVTALAALPSRGLVAAGCELGYALTDIRHGLIVLTNSFISQHELSDAGRMDDGLSRFKSLKKSIRQSFRKKKKVDSNNTTADANTSSRLEEIDDEEVTRPVERRIEARDNGGQGSEAPTWLIRSLQFAHAAVSTPLSSTDCLWVGTNGGRLLCYALADNAKHDEVCKLVRELRLAHAAPILHVACLTDAGKNVGSGQRVVVFTEEQMRSYSLPLLKPLKFKLKLTGVEGARIRKATIVSLQNSTEPIVSESFAAIITNLGEVNVISLQSAKRRCKGNLFKATDIAGMTSSVLSPTGEVFSLRPGGSEVQRASLARLRVPIAFDFPPPLPEE